MIDQANVGAQQRKHLEDPRSRRVHADVAHRERLARREARCDEKKRRRRDVAGHSQSRSLQ
jgi:hypothetical protein